MNQLAKEGQVFVCGACGKRSKDRYGEEAIDLGWDVSCAVSAILCDKKSIGMKDGRVISADEIE